MIERKYGVEHPEPLSGTIGFVIQAGVWIGILLIGLWLRANG